MKKILGKMKFQMYGLLTILLVLALATVAFADDISNNIDLSVDAVAEVMSLNVGGANGTTSLYLVERNGDGKNGCNLTGSTTLVLSVSSSDPSVATVSPSSVTFTSCGFTQALTVAPHNQGSATISVALTSNDSDGTFNLAPATFTVNVAPPPNTAPQVNITGVTGGASYELGSVPAATCQVTDAEDGNSSFAATLSAVSGSLSAYGLGEQTASCSYTDAGGLTASASVTYGIVDTTAPVITLVSRTAANENGWNNENVTVEWSCSDSGSGVVAATVSQTVITEGANQSVTGTCVDNVGNTAVDTVTDIHIDKTAPTIDGAADRPANEFGWYNADVTVSFKCVDGLSGVDTCSGDVILSEGEGQSATGTVTDKAGNSASATLTGINIDKTNPVISGTASPAANGYGWNNTAVTVSFTCSDALSGVVECPANVILADEGTNQSASGTVYDKAGNSATTDVENINIDKTAPVVSLVGGPVNGTSYYYGFVPAAPTCIASEVLSGLDGTCALTGYSSALGTHTVTASATDKAGNSNSASTTYTVLAWTLKGFYQPVDMGATVVNIAKNGSTVPLKFEVFAGSTELTSTSIVHFSTKSVSCKDGAVGDDIEMYTSGATTLRYDLVGGQYIFNWQTPKAPGTCYLVTMTTDDGSSISANFRLK